MRKRQKSVGFTGVLEGGNRDKPRGNDDTFKYVSKRTMEEYLSYIPSIKCGGGRRILRKDRHD